MVDFDRTRSALLVIDFQNYGFDPRGYRVIVLEDCCVTMTDEEHESSISVVLSQIGTVITADEFIRSLGR